MTPADYLRISYSSLNTFSSCARKFEFSKLFKHRARESDFFAAEVGKALHVAYQNYLVFRSVDKAMWALLESYPHELYFNQEKDERSLYTAIVLLEEMIESMPMLEYELMQIRRPDGMIVPAIEVPFEIRLEGITLPDGRGVAFVGFMDAVMRNLATEEVSTLDIKTHRRFIADAEAKYRFDSQQVPYGICLEHIQGKAPDEFKVLYLDCFVDLAAPRVQLYSYQKDMEDVREWLQALIVDVQAMQQYMQLDFFPRSRNGCMNFNKACFFLDICQTRDKDSIQEWFLMGEEPMQRPPEIPWIVASIDVYGSEPVE